MFRALVGLFLLWGVVGCQSPPVTPTSSSPVPVIGYINAKGQRITEVQGSRITLSDRGGKRLTAKVTSHLKGAGHFRTQQTGVLPHRLAIEVTRGDELYTGSLLITSDEVYFEIIGNLGDELLLHVSVLDADGGVIASAEPQQIVLDGTGEPIGLTIVLPGDQQEVVSVPVNVSLIHPSSAPVPIQIVGAQAGLVSGPQDPASEPLEGLENTMLVVNADRNSVGASLELYDGATGTKQILATANTTVMSDVAVDRDAGMIYRVGNEGIGSASFHPVFRDGKWTVDIGRWTQIPLPRFEGYVSQENPPITSLSGVRLLDSDHLLLFATNPYNSHGKRFWVYELSTGALELLHDDSRAGERFGYDPISTLALYGQVSSKGRLYEWLLFDLATKQFRSLITPSLQQQIRFATLLPGAQQFAYFGPTNAVTVQDVETGATQVFPVSQSVESLCWNKSATMFAVASSVDGHRFYDAQTGNVLQSTAPVGASRFVINSCQFL